MSTLQYIRDYYKVPAKRGMRVRLYDGREGVITSASTGSGNLRVRVKGSRYSAAYHPTWKMEYLDAAGNVIWPLPHAQQRQMQSPPGHILAIDKEA